MSMERTRDLWPWYKEILATVEAALLHKLPGSRAKLEMVLKDAENDFKNLLQNPAPNSTDAASLRKAVTDGISLPGNKPPKPQVAFKDENFNMFRSRQSHYFVTIIGGRSAHYL